MTVEMNIFRMDGQISDPKEQEEQVNMIHRLEMDRDTTEELKTDCGEASRSLIEEEQSQRPFWRMKIEDDFGDSIFDEDAERDDDFEQSLDEDKESPRPCWRTLIDDNFGQSIFEENDLSVEEKVEWDDHLSSVNLEVIESLIMMDDYIDEKMDEYSRLDNNEAEVCRTSSQINWKKKKGRMRKKKRIRWEREEVVILPLMSSNTVIDILKRTHFESGKRSRGRNKPSLI
jgi:hypothetical protein